MALLQYLIWKLLLLVIWSGEDWGGGSTFTFCHALLKKAILLYKEALVEGGGHLEPSFVSYLDAADYQISVLSSFYNCVLDLGLEKN